MMLLESPSARDGTTPCQAHATPDGTPKNTPKLFPIFITSTGQGSGFLKLQAFRSVFGEYEGVEFAKFHLRQHFVIF